MNFCWCLMTRRHSHGITIVLLRVWLNGESEGSLTGAPRPCRHEEPNNDTAV